MKVINIFNGRRERGGEDVVYELVGEILEQRNIEVVNIKVKELDYNGNFFSKVKAFFSGIFSISSFFKYARLFTNTAPDIVHVHNLYPSISPSIFLAAKLTNTPILYHSHNFLLTCPVGNHFRSKVPCEKCVNGLGVSAIVHNCRGNMFESFAYWMRFFIARLLGFFQKYCSAVIVVSKFSQSLLEKSGFPKDKIVLLPNAVRVPNDVKRQITDSYILFVGRINEEKGIFDLLGAASQLDHVKFLVVGDGLLKNEVESINLSNVEFAGWMDSEKLLDVYSKALIAIVPSWGYETFGLAAAESMSYGIPTIVSNRGGLLEFAKNDTCAVSYEPGNVIELCEKIEYLLSNKSTYRALAKNGKQLIESEYSYNQYAFNLLSIYESVVKEHGL